jgi:hypothetical protein
LYASARLAWLRARRQRANARADAYNRAHPAACAELNRLTGDACGSGARVDVAALRAWQGRQQLVSDGRAGPQTLAAARRIARARDGEARADVTFSDDEARADANPADGDTGGEPLAARVVADGDTDGLEHRAPATDDEARARQQEQGAGAKEAIEQGVAGFDGPALPAAGRRAALATRVPALVELLRARHYREAIAYVVGSVRVEERIELLHAALARLAAASGRALAPHLAGLLERAALAGAVVDVLALGWEWTAAGLDAIRAAHAHGDRDSRIAVYAWAWSDTILGNRHANPGAVTQEERAAMELGIVDGHETLARAPELPALLVAEYGDRGNARRALEDALLARAGVDGVRTHAGR